MAPKDLRGKVAIVGASESDEMGKLPDKSVLTLHAESIRNALDDAGLSLGDVDGLFMAGGSPETTVNDLCEYLGVVPRYADSTIVGGCSFIMHVEHAMLALSAGLINTAVISHGESGRSRMGLPGFADESATHNGQFEDPFGVVRPDYYFLDSRDPAHAQVRHDSGAAGGGVGGDAEVGNDASQGPDEGPNHHPGRDGCPHDLLAIHTADVLPGDRRRRGDSAHNRGPGQGPEAQAGVRSRDG